MIFKAYNVKTRSIHDVAMIDYELNLVRYKENPSAACADAKLTDCILLPSTGLEDVNRQDLFLGDLVKEVHNDKIYKIIWHADGVSYHALDQDGTLHFLFRNVGDDVLIDPENTIRICNYHENPELFKE